VAVFEALSCRLAPNLLKSTNLEFTTSPTISYIRCCAFGFFVLGINNILSGLDIIRIFKAF